MPQPALMEQKRILIVEDDKNISQVIQYNFEKAGYACTAVKTGEDIFDFLNENSVDLIILDIMLPKMSGFDVCKRLKQDPDHANIPIIVVSARGEETDRILGLELGADDYVVKPFSPRELILRAKIVLKSDKTKEDDSKEILIFEDLRIDIPRHEVFLGKKEIKLTPMEFKLLVTLLKRQGRVQTRDQLLNDVWDLNSEVTTRTIDTHISFLRRKLGRMGKVIECVRGYGYRLTSQE